MSNKKQKARFSVTDITNQYFRNFLKKFKNSPYLGYKSKKVHDEPTEAYFLLIKPITRLMKSERRSRPNFVKLGVNEKSDTSTYKYNMRNWKSKTKQLHAWIKKNKLRVRMILRENKRLRAHLIRKKKHILVIFVYVNAVNFSSLQPSNTHAQHRRLTSVR